MNELVKIRWERNEENEERKDVCKEACCVMEDGVRLC